MKISITFDLSKYDRMAIARHTNSDADKPASRSECIAEIEAVVQSHLETLRFDAYGADGDDGDNDTSGSK